MIIEQLFLQYFHAAETRAAERKIGLEQEIFAFDSSGRRLDYADIAGVLEFFSSEYQWSKLYEGQNLIALKKDGSSITLEPGGQLELSLKPLASIVEIEAELGEHLAALQAYSRRQSSVPDGKEVRWLSVGYDPFNTPGSIPLMPKRRYDTMRDYLPQFGDGVLEMMLATCGVQSNFDYIDEQNAADMLLVSTAFASVSNVLLACSPFRQGKATGYHSLRASAWERTDPSRTGFVPRLFGEEYRYQDYIDYVCATPMLVVMRDALPQDMSGKDFVRFCAGAYPLAPTEKDVQAQLEAVFPVARLKNTVETRATDAASPELILAQAAFWKGLLYCDTSLQQAKSLALEMGEKRAKDLLDQSIHEGFAAQSGDWRLDQLCQNALDLAKNGLGSIAPEELHYLAPLQSRLDLQQTLAGEIAAAYNAQTQGADLWQVFDRFSVSLA